MGCWGKEKGQTPAGKRAKNKRLKMPRGTAKAETCEADRQICHCHCRCSTGSRPAAHRRMCKTTPRTSFGAAFCSSGITADTMMCYVQSPTFPPHSPDNIFRGFVGLLLEALSSPHSLAPGWASKAISPPSTGINGTWERRRKTVSSEIISFNRNGEGWATGSRSPCNSAKQAGKNQTGVSALASWHCRDAARGKSYTWTSPRVQTEEERQESQRSPLLLLLSKGMQYLTARSEERTVTQLNVIKNLRQGCAFNPPFASISMQVLMKVQKDVVSPVTRSLRCSDEDLHTSLWLLLTC